MVNKQEARCKKTRAWCSNLSKLCKSHLAVEYLYAPLPVNGTERPTEAQKRWDSLKAQLKKYERMETLSLLELAILKGPGLLLFGVRG
jgi:hypothetical protein